MSKFEPTYEKCNSCPYCYTDEGESGWYCNAKADILESEDYLPCKEGENSEQL